MRKKNVTAVGITDLVTKLNVGLIQLMLKGLLNYVGLLIQKTSMFRERGGDSYYLFKYYIFSL